MRLHKLANQLILLAIGNLQHNTIGRSPEME